MTEEREAQPPIKKPGGIPRNLKPYYLCFLVKGEKWNAPDGGLQNLAAAQIAFIREQIEWRRYKFAGPVTDGGEIVGFCVIEAESPEAAAAIANQDPAVQANCVTTLILPSILPSLDSLKVEFSSEED